MRRRIMESLVTIGSDTNKPQDGTRKKVYIKTYGCQMNEYDSQKLLKILESTHDPVARPEDADLVLVNTCSVREKPEQKVYSMAGEIRDLKKTRPNILLGIGGCVAQQEGEKIIQRSPGVDFVFGTHNLSLVPSLIKMREQSGRPQVAVDYRDEWEELPLGLRGNERVSAFVSISRGCNKNCTYCIVPTTRGPEVSRALSEIEREIKLLVHRGVKEVVLLGQTVNSWGLDMTPRRRFTELLEIVSAIPGVERIRFTSPHPQEVREDFFAAVRDNPKICKSIHMPLQSGSDRILKGMKRNYRRARYLEIIEGLKAACPEIGITTDIIVGFPGETRQDFEETLEVMKLVRFDNSYSFMFSPRPGTAAEKLVDDVTPEEKLARLQELQALQLEHTTELLRSCVGKTYEVLIDGPSSNDATLLQGRNTQNIVINLTQQYQDLSPGDLVPVKIEAASKFTLRGVVAAG